ncbi:prephenate dehydrogenase/arogenate dehydrogenase family protein [Streptomyces sp. H34-S4]|uniref:prephenate dehydrogenase/arogenate dehydrogenase family protein n=1 Tax=Streptomyces sp. H34-S4 TaxID=2996463 RepID=UPI00226EF504|nr:prephenate dehydrogenase/arogenate dehydrogenase family protein [Streptomyces sp. H34-S4]MCY0937380.1 prephenate dehydrogenase/arogenate dehydrogenase family protein [Streptomyces sp. H34-S4]
MTSTPLRSVTVIGCGPTGTSIALALTRAGVDVALDDNDPRALDRALRAGAGSLLLPGDRPADVVVVATDPSTAADVLYEAQARGLGRAYTDVHGTDESMWQEILLRGCDQFAYVPGRPPGAPRTAERGAASADRFEGRPWLLIPGPATPPEAVAAVRELVALCGAIRHQPPAPAPSQSVTFCARQVATPSVAHQRS